MVTECALCAAPERRAATDRCHACDRDVCERHLRVLYGVCKECATDEGLARVNREPERARPRDVLGIKWVED